MPYATVPVPRPIAVATAALMASRREMPIERSIVNPMNVVDEFEWRGMVYDASDGTREMFERERVTAYIGFDPTASSLHVGSLLPIMALARLQRADTPRSLSSAAAPG